MARLPETRPSLAREIRYQKRQMRRLGTASPFTNSGMAVTGTGQTVVQNGSVTIPYGGQLVVDGGDVLLLDSDGSVLFRVGPQTHGDRGVSIYRNDGTLAFEIRNAFSATDSKQMVRIVDSLGKTIGGDALLSPSGFDAPHIPLDFEPVNLSSSTRAQSTTSATFVALFEYYGYHQNPGMQLEVKAWCSDATTAGEVQVWDVINSVYLDTFFGTPPPSVISVPAGTTTATLFTMETVVLPGGMSDNMHLEVHARRVAGTGTLNVAVARSHGFSL